MAASKHGNGNWGISDESGVSDANLYIQSLTAEVSEEEALLPNHEGEDVGVSLFNESCTINGDGFTVTNNDAGQTLGGLMTIASDSIYGTISTVATFWVNSMTLTNANKDFQQGSFVANGRPGITVT